MGKQRTIERIRAGEDTIGQNSGIPDLFREHYELALRSMTPEHAAAQAHDAVQRHLATLGRRPNGASTAPEEVTHTNGEGGEAMP